MKKLLTAITILIVILSASLSKADVSLNLKAKAPIATASDQKPALQHFSETSVIPLEKVVEHPQKPSQNFQKNDQSAGIRNNNNFEASNKNISFRIKTLNRKGSINSLSFRKRILFPFHDFV